MNANLFDYDSVSHTSDVSVVDLSTSEGMAKFERFLYDIREVIVWNAFCKRVDKTFGASTERLIEEMEE